MAGWTTTPLEGGLGNQSFDCLLHVRQSASINRERVVTLALPDIRPVTLLW